MLALGALLAWSAMSAYAQPGPNLLQNPSFEEGLGADGLPVGWSLYAGQGQEQRVTLIGTADSGDQALLLEDGDQTAEIGLTQKVRAEPGVAYQLSAAVRGVEGQPSFGAYLQLRFLPSNELVQASLAAPTAARFTTVSVKGLAPPDTTEAVIYIYTHRDPTPQVIVDSVELIPGVEPPPPPPPAPEPPTYGALKDLHLQTDLVRGGEANVTVVKPAGGSYDGEAARIAEAIRGSSGVAVPVVSDDSPAAAVPVAGNLIVLGNRSTNRTIGELYTRYFTLLDLRYPGPGGTVVRTLHNPFGDGWNVVFVGGSDAEGVRAAAEVFVQELRPAGGGPGRLSVGYLAETRLGTGVTVPTDLRQFETWEASAGYGSVGYFGWNSLSKRLAMYYMTGDPFQAREFIRLAFPDEQAKQEIAGIDGERIENKDEPLSGPYHYNAHLMILYWDLVEESPVFTDEERLRVTNAFAKQLRHRAGEGIYGLAEPPPAVGSRHGQWAAISLYCLGRYFQRDYPHPIWQHCCDAAALQFAPLHQHNWVDGENDNLFWYNTAIAPIFTYLLLSGDRVPVQNGVLGELLRAQEVLISGRRPDWALTYAALDYLHKTAYLMQDGRYLTYRDRTGVDTSTFRLGQSFWPEDRLRPRPPDDLVGRWTINRPPLPMWQERGSGLLADESFLFGSFRSAADAGGDFALLDGFNGASRNPYHTFDVLELRLGGYTLLRGYHNQVLTSADGLVEPRVAMDAALQQSTVVGQTASAVGEVPNAAYCTWRRELAQRVGRTALVVDDLTFRAPADNMEARFEWETEGAPRAAEDGSIEFAAPTEVGERRSDPGGQVRPCDPVRTSVAGTVATMSWVGAVREGERRVFFSLVGMQPGEAGGSLQCLRVADNAAALALPGPGLAVAGRYEGMEAGLAVLAGDHLYGRALTAAALGVPLVRAASPVDVDWDFASGSLAIAAPTGTAVSLALAGTEGATLDGRPLDVQVGADGLRVLNLPAGEHRLEAARLAVATVEALGTALADRLRLAREQRAQALTRLGGAGRPNAPPLEERFRVGVGGSVVGMATVPAEGGPVLYVAEGQKVHVLGPNGAEQQALATDGPIRMLRWWPEHELLLVGCVDEQVIAFDRAGNRRWVFTSEMDPAVYAAAKTYWFKSAPGHEGIHGLYTGVLLDGKSQAFVGSACTLEILDEDGRLLHRMPQFWGTVATFAIIPGPEGSLNLLAGRRYNDSPNAAIISNRTLDPNPRGFDSVPPGHTWVGGWSAQNRDHLFTTDLDGDGQVEVVSEINGTWNRVTVWNLDGQALRNAQFGPGDSIPARNMRDLDVADLDGDGRQEVVAATSRGLVVTLDCECRKLWATRLPSPPTVLKCLRAADGAPWVVVGCEDGTVAVLDAGGAVVRLGRVTGAPTCVGALGEDGAGPVLLATTQGEVGAFALQ